MLLFYTGLSLGLGLGPGGWTWTSSDEEASYVVSPKKRVANISGSGYAIENQKVSYLRTTNTCAKP
jgi:hypothetical protein